jgi:hypothetical protein
MTVGNANQAANKITKSAVKMHTLLNLRGNIPSFIHISNGKLHDVHALDMLISEPGAIYVSPRSRMTYARSLPSHGFQAPAGMLARRQLQPAVAAIGNEGARSLLLRSSAVPGRFLGLQF